MNQLKQWLKVLYLSKEYWEGVCYELPEFTTPLCSCGSTIEIAYIPPKD